MATRHLVDPDLYSALDQFSPVVLTMDTLPQLRALFDEMLEQGKQLEPEYPDIDVSERRIPGPVGAPDVRVLVYRPRNSPHLLPALLWIHGGGLILGSADGADAWVKGVVDAVGCAAVSVDYRLSPETAFPGPLEDCYAALKWLYQVAADLGVDAGRIAIGGDSAGGGLAAGLGLLARDRAELPLAFQLLIYPMLDDRTVTTTDPHPYCGEYIWTPELNRFGWSSYLGEEPGSAKVSPYAAAARADSLSGLPATFVCVGALDLFLEEDIEYARRLLREGVPTELHVYPGSYHGFPIAPDAWMTRAYLASSMEALKRGLSPRKLAQ